MTYQKTSLGYGIRLSYQLNAHLERLSRRRKITRNAAIIEAIQLWVEQNQTQKTDRQAS